MADIGQFQQSAFSNPADGSAATAAGVRANDNALATKHNNHDNDHTIHVLTFADLGSFAAASGRTGALAIALDTQQLYVSDGASWDAIPYRLSTVALTAADIGAGSFPAGAFTFQQGLTVTGEKTTLAATAAGYASANLPHGTAPSSPADGDLWTTTAGIFVRVNGATVGPLITRDASTFAYRTLRRTSGVTLNNSTGTTIVWETSDASENASTDLAWTAGGSGDEIAVAVPGLYDLTFAFRYTGTVSTGSIWGVEIQGWDGSSWINIAGATGGSGGASFPYFFTSTIGEPVEISGSLAFSSYHGSGTLTKIRFRVYNGDASNRTLTPSTTDVCMVRIQRVF